jgi:hypothetical protein
MRLWASSVAALLLALLPGRPDAATDFSGETEFASSDQSKYPDTGNVVPYQPVRPPRRRMLHRC